jgi:hypothetical protein
MVACEVANEDVFLATLCLRHSASRTNHCRLRWKANIHNSRTVTRHTLGIIPRLETFAGVTRLPAALAPFERPSLALLLKLPGAAFSALGNSLQKDTFRKF